MSSPALQVRIRVPRPVEALWERPGLTVVPRRRPTAARVPFVVLVSALLIGGVVGLLVVNTTMQQASFRAAALQERADELTAREQKLRMELDALRDPQRVAEQARALGMVTSCTPAFLRMGDGSVIGRAVPASSQCTVQISPPLPPLPAVLAPQPRYVDAPPGESTTTKTKSDGKKKPDTSSTGSTAATGSTVSPADGH